MPQGFAGHKANQAYTALHHGEGVWGFGKDAEIERPKALQDAKPTKRGIENLLHFYKNRLFIQSAGKGFPLSFFVVYIKLIRFVKKF